MSDYIVVCGIKVCQEFSVETFGRLITIGPKFRLLTVVQVCRCSCGNFRLVRRERLETGKTRSCGCLQKERVAVTGKLNATHGKSQTKEFTCFTDMKTRCYNPKYRGFKNYGGRGIRVCDRWMDSENGFVNFCADMGPIPPGHEIDRIDTDGHYCQENCRWVTLKEQARNKGNNRIITHRGKSQCLFAWAEEFAIPPKVFWSRLKRGWEMERALVEPLRNKPKRD